SSLAFWTITRSKPARNSSLLPLPPSPALYRVRTKALHIRPPQTPGARVSSVFLLYWLAVRSPGYRRKRHAGQHVLLLLWGADTGPAADSPSPQAFPSRAAMRVRIAFSRSHRAVTSRRMAATPRISLFIPR